MSCKLLGGGRPRIVKAPKLRTLAPGNKCFNVLGSIFRSLEKHLFLYDHHTKCQFVADKYCNFCAMRSISQRLNQRKREPFIEAHEINQNVKNENNVEIFLDNFISQISTSFPDFCFNEALNIVCNGCHKIHRNEKGTCILIDPTKEKEDLEIETLLNKEIIKVGATVVCCGAPKKNLKIHENQTFLFVMFKKKC